MRKEFPNDKAQAKERQLQQQKASKQALKKNKKEVQASLNSHRLGWVIDGKES